MTDTKREVEKRPRRRRLIKITLGIVVFLIAVRLALPYMGTAQREDVVKSADDVLMDALARHATTA